MSKQRIEFTLGFKADIAQAQRELETLASSLKKLSTSSPTILDGKQFNEASQAAFELEQHLEKAVNVNTGKLDLTKFASSLRSSGKDLQHYQQKLSQIGPEGKQAFNQLARSIANAEVPTVQINKHLASFLTTLKNTAKWQLTSNITHGLQSGLQQALSYAESLNKSLVDIQIVTSMSTAEMAKFAEQANKVARTLSVSTTDYTKASLIYFQQGLDEKEVETRVGITSKMAAITGQTTETISDQLTSIWNNFYDGSKSLEYYADVLTRLGADTASSSDEIVQGLQKFSSVADTIGLSYEYAAASLATITSTTRESADVVGTALKTLFSRIQGLKLGETLEDGVDLNKYSEALDKVGVKVLDQNNELREMDVILDDLAAKWNTLGKAQQTSLAQTVAGVRQYTQLITLMDNWDFMQQNIQSGMNSEGSLNEQFSFYEQGVEASAQRVQTALQNTYSSLIDDQFLVQANNALTEVIDGMSGFIDIMGGLPGIITTISTILLSTFASKVPAALNSLGNFFRTTFGIARKETYQLQDATQEYIQTQLKAATNPVEKLELQGLEKLLEMRKQLTLEAKNMTIEEQEAYKIDIQRVQEMYEMVKARTKSTELVKAELAAQTEMMAQAAGKMGNINIGIAAQEKQAAFNSITNSSKYREWRATQAQKIQTKYANDPKTINKAMESVNVKTYIDAATNGKITGLTDKDLQRINNAQAAIEKLNKATSQSGNGYRQNAQEARKLMSEIEKLGDNYGELTVNIKQTSNTIKAMNTNTLSGNQQQEIQQMINGFRQLAQTVGFSDTEIENLLGSVNLLGDEWKTMGSEQIANNFNNLGIQIQDLIMEQIQAGETTEGLAGKINLLGKVTGKDTELLQKYANAVMEFGRESQEAKLAYEALMNTPVKPPTHIVQMSQAVASMGSALVSMGMQITSITSAFDTLTDDSTSAATKIGALASAAFSATFMIREFGKGWKDTIDVLSRSSKYIDKAAEMTAKAAKNGGKVTNIFAKMGTTVSEAGVATVSSAGAAAAALGPVLIALAAVAAAIAAIVISHKKWQESAQKTAQTLRDEAQASQEEIKANRELVKAMNSAYSAYLKNQDNKEELDNATYALAEAYKVEGASLAALTGKYEDYSEILEKVKKLQQADYQEQAEKTDVALAAQAQDILRTSAGGAFGDWKTTRDIKNNATSAILNFGGVGAGEKEYVDILLPALQEAGLQVQEYGSGLGFTLHLSSDPKEIAKAYDIISEFNTKALAEMGGDLFDKADTAREVEDWLAKIKEKVESLKSLQENDTINKLFATGLDIDLSSIDNYKDYLAWVEEARVKLGDLYTNTEEFQFLLNTLGENSGNELFSTFKAYDEQLKILKQKVIGTEEDIIGFWNNLSDEEKKLLLSMDINPGETLDHLKSRVEYLSENLPNIVLGVEISNTKKALDALKDGLQIEDIAILDSVEGFNWKQYVDTENKSNDQIVLDIKEALAKKLKEDAGLYDSAEELEIIKTDEHKQLSGEATSYYRTAAALSAPRWTKLTASSNSPYYLQALSDIYNNNNVEDWGIGGGDQYYNRLKLLGLELIQGQGIKDLKTGKMLDDNTANLMSQIVNTDMDSEGWQNVVSGLVNGIPTSQSWGMEYDKLASSLTEEQQKILIDTLNNNASTIGKNKVNTLVTAMTSNEEMDWSKFTPIDINNIQAFLRKVIGEVNAKAESSGKAVQEAYEYINYGGLEEDKQVNKFFNKEDEKAGADAEQAANDARAKKPDILNISSRYYGLDEQYAAVEAEITRYETLLEDTTDNEQRKWIEDQIEALKTRIDANDEYLSLLEIELERQRQAKENAITDFTALRDLFAGDISTYLGEQITLKYDSNTGALLNVQEVRQNIVDNISGIQADYAEQGKTQEELDKVLELPNRLLTLLDTLFSNYTSSFSTYFDSTNKIKDLEQQDIVQKILNDFSYTIRDRFASYDEAVEKSLDEFNKALDELAYASIGQKFENVINAYDTSIDQKTNRLLGPDGLESKIAGFLAGRNINDFSFASNPNWKDEVARELEAKRAEIEAMADGEAKDKVLYDWEQTEKHYNEAIDLEKELGDLTKAREDFIKEARERLEEELKAAEDLVDVYAALNRELEKIDRTIQRIEKDRKDAFGQGYLDTFDEELKALEKEDKTLTSINNKIETKRPKRQSDIQKSIDAASDGFKELGVVYDTETGTWKYDTKFELKFDEEGFLENEEELRESANALVELYRSIAEAAQKAADEAKLAAETTVDDPTTEIDEQAEAKAAWDEAEAKVATANTNLDAVSNYVTDIFEKVDKANNEAKTYVDNAEKMADNARRWLEINFERWNYTLELGLEVNDRDLEMLEYKLGKIEDDIYSVGEAWTLTNQQVASHFTGFDVINQSYENLTNLFNAGQITPAKYAEGLKSIYSEAMEGAKSLDEIDEKMRTFYSDTLDLAIEQIDKYASALEHQTSMLEHYYNLITLINGEADYEKIGMILEGQAKTLENEMKFSTEQYQNAVNAQTEYQAFFDTLSDEDKKKYQANLDAINEQVREAEEEMLSDTEAWAEKLKEILENKMAEAGDILEKTFSGGMGFDSLNDSIDRLNDYQDIYLTKTNQVYEVQKLMRTAQQAADKTDNAAAKQRINNFVQETKKLQEKNKLSHLELEIQQAQYDMLMAQIALEEAKNAKTTVRLRRDNQGNFGYVYTADQEQVAKAEQELADAENRLYNISLEATNEWGQKRLELQQQYADAMIELEERRANGEFATDEMYQQERDRITQEFYRNMEAYSGEYTIALNGHANTQADAWIRAYEDMMAESDKWNEATTQYLDANEKAYGEWKDEVAKNSAIVDGVLKNTQTEVQKVTDKSEELRKKGNEVAASMWTQVSAAQGAQKEYINLSRTVDDLRLDYLNMAAAAQSALDQISKINSLQMVNPYYTTYKNTNGDLSSLMTQHIASGGQIGDMKWEALTQIRDEKIQANGNVSAFMTNAQIQQILSDYTNSKDSNPDALSVQWVNAILSGQAHYTPENYQKFMEELEKRNWIPGIKLFDTGGYTGEWGPQGRLAVVHEKELVLKQDDTANFLLATGMLRNIASMIDLNAANSLLASGLQNPFAAAAYAPGTIDQNVTIEAHFPNATDRDEITEAFNTLINTASQYANRKTK